MSAERATVFAGAAMSANTRRAYASDLRDFEVWAHAHGVRSLPATPDAVAAYLTRLAHAGLRLTTLERRTAALAQAHKLRGLPVPTADACVRAVLEGLRRALGASSGGKAPADKEGLVAMLRALPKGTLLGARDRALLLVGFAGGFRRSELVALNLEDLTFERARIVVTIRGSTSDQGREAREVSIPFGAKPELCPVRALRTWLTLAKTDAGAVFRTVSRHGRAGARLRPPSVALVIKRAARAAGLDPARYAGHSLRIGLVTSAANAGATEHAIMATTGHRSVTSVRRCIRGAERLSDNAAAFALR